ncbi:MAG TPA: serine/threonine-protein kinase [Kofleriaceae bacterium]|nr:serine/threonine-protein kinase [Kofleriaceae bacterium]
MGRPVDQARPEVTHLGPYEIVRKLARGGMAELFLARTTGVEGIPKLVVLKKILPSHAENPKFVRLFLDEAKLASTLEHPHIARVFDMGRAEGHYFFTMEHVHGQDVRTTMRRLARVDQKFPVPHAVQIARDVAAALHYAHERRREDGTLLDIVHRDVSPSNILVSYEGAVKLVDFGVAKAATSTVKTRTGALKGKIAYMSPEQAKGAPIDRRSDIFSLGIVLWEMLTGERLFKAENDLATIQRIINSNAQPPSQVRPECPPELDRVVLRALANDLEQRYQTAEQLQLDLEALAYAQSSDELRAYMQQLFGEEIRAWSLAQAAGQTLTEFIVDKATSMTTPVSESEIYSLDDFEHDDEDDELEGAETIAPTAPSAPPTLKLEPLTTQVAPLIDPSEAPTEIAAMPPVVIAPELGVPGVTTPFPIAPPEWRSDQPASQLAGDLATQRTKRILIGASIAFGVIVLLAALLAGSPPAPPPAKAPAPDRIEMKSVPTTELAPATP